MKSVMSESKLTCLVSHAGVEEVHAGRGERDAVDGVGHAAGLAARHGARGRGRGGRRWVRHARHVARVRVAVVGRHGTGAAAAAAVWRGVLVEFVDVGIVTVSFVCSHRLKTGLWRCGWNWVLTVRVVRCEHKICSLSKSKRNFVETEKKNDPSDCEMLPTFPLSYETSPCSCDFTPWPKTYKQYWCVYVQQFVSFANVHCLLSCKSRICFGIRKCKNCVFATICSRVLSCVFISDEARMRLKTRVAALVQEPRAGVARSLRATVALCRRRRRGDTGSRRGSDGTRAKSQLPRQTCGDASSLVSINVKVWKTNAYHR